MPATTKMTIVLKLKTYVFLERYLAKSTGICRVTYKIIRKIFTKKEGEKKKKSKHNLKIFLYFIP